MHSYMADCTLPGSRSHVFSLALGLLFVGTSIGPTLGSVLIRLTHTPISVFIYAASVHLVYVLYLFFIVPESLPDRVRLMNKKRIQDRKVKDLQIANDTVGWRGVGVLRVKRTFAFLRPLAELVPHKVENGNTRRWDWNLLFIAASYGFSQIVIVCRSFIRVKGCVQ
jgi:hypothetical protein